MKTLDESIENSEWNDIKDTPEHEAYKLGVKLKNLRSKRWNIDEFVKKSGLTKYKVLLIENAAHKAKLIDIIKYVEDGLEMVIDLGNDPTHRTLDLMDICSNGSEEDFIIDSETFLKSLVNFPISQTV